MTTLGKKIRELRIQKGLTQSDLGSGHVTPSMISQIEADKANPSYKVLEAIAEKLDTSLEYFLTDVQSHLEQGTAYKVARAQMASNSYGRAAELLTILLEQKASNLNVFDIKIDLALCYVELSREEEAISTLEEVVDQSLSKQQHHAALRALNALASVEKRRRKYHHAIYYWRKGCELFDHLEVTDPFLQGEILNSLGSIHLDLGETQEAIAYYKQANQLLSNTSNLDQIGQTYLGLASSYRQKEEPELASVYASYAVAMFETLKNLKLAIEVKREFAAVNQDGKTRTDALQKLEECLVESKRYNFTDLCALIHSDIAWVHLQQQEPLLGLQAAEEGLIMAETGSVPAATLHRMKGIALEKLDMHREAVEVMEQAIQVYKSHELKADVADCYALLAELYQQAGDEKTANNCLIHMRQIMQEILKERGFVFTA